MQLHRETTTTQLALAALRAYHIALFPAPPHVGVWGWAAAVVVVVAVVAVVLSGGRLDTMPTLQQRQQPPLPGASHERVRGERGEAWLTCERMLLLPGPVDRPCDRRFGHEALFLAVDPVGQARTRICGEGGFDTYRRARTT